MPTQCRQQVVCVLAVCNGERRFDVFDEVVVNVTEYFFVDVRLEQEWSCCCSGGVIDGAAQRMFV